MRWITIGEHHVRAVLNNIIVITIDIDYSNSKPDDIRYYLEITDQTNHLLARDQYIKSINDAKVSAIVFIEGLCAEMLNEVRRERDRWIGQYYADHPDLAPKDE